MQPRHISLVIHEIGGQLAFLFLQGPGHVRRAMMETSTINFSQPLGILPNIGLTLSQSGFLHPLFYLLAPQSPVVVSGKKWLFLAESGALVCDP